MTDILVAALPYAGLRNDRRRNWALSPSGNYNSLSGWGGNWTLAVSPLPSGTSPATPRSTCIRATTSVSRVGGPYLKTDFTFDIGGYWVALSAMVGTEGAAITSRPKIAWRNASGTLIYETNGTTQTILRVDQGLTSVVYVAQAPAGTRSAELYPAYATSVAPVSTVWIVTGAMVEVTTTAVTPTSAWSAYLDGDTKGLPPRIAAIWEGTPGASTSLMMEHTIDLTRSDALTLRSDQVLVTDTEQEQEAGVVPLYVLGRADPIVVSLGPTRRRTAKIEYTCFTEAQYQRLIYIHTLGTPIILTVAGDPLAATGVPQWAGYYQPTIVGRAIDRLDTQAEVWTLSVEAVEVDPSYTTGRW